MYVYNIFYMPIPPDCLVGDQMSLQHTRERVGIFEQPVQGLVANLGKGTVRRGKEGERCRAVQDVRGGSVVEGGSEGGDEGGEAVVGGESLVEGEGAGGGLGGDDASWGEGEGGVGGEGYGGVWKGYCVSRERNWVEKGCVRGKRYGIRI